MMSNSTFPSWRYLWAKTLAEGSAGEQPFHPLICHLIDTALVAQELWAHAAAPGLRERVARALGLDDQRAGNWVAFLAALHDLGKATPAFQRQWPPGQAALRERGFRFPSQDRRIPHGTMTAVLAQRTLAALGLSVQTATRLSTVAGGHHGLFPRADERNQVGPLTLGSDEWDRARSRLVESLMGACGAAGQPVPQVADDGEHALGVLFAGLTSVADWIASDVRYFPFAPVDIDLADYAARAQAQAREALADQGWLQWDRNLQPASFRELFDVDPRPLQEVTVQLAESLPAPALVLVESPMGEGKTEAAMYLADRASQWAGHQGAYFALPTEATSNQMFGRVQRFLARRYGDGPVNLQLLHGHAALSAEFEVLRRKASGLLAPQGVAVDDPNTPSNVMAAEWFTYRKRGLLAAYGVGTVDQALLAVLQTKHFFVRLYGLAHKTVIIDEVHAYDSYMTELMERLVSWLAALGSSVILLSATLPRDRRMKLVEAFQRGTGRGITPGLREEPYPRVTWCTAEGSGSLSVKASDHAQRKVGITWVDGRLPAAENAPFLLGESLRQALAGGGCAAVICNTVDTAQQVFSRLKHYFSPEELDLFHARYPYEERAQREARTLERFSKGARRPDRAVLVATQVLEQSLDLDFDLLVTYLAPVDLVLQRAGRLYRHARSRPPAFSGPNLWLCGPEEFREEVPRFDAGTETVYDRHVLLRSWLALQGREAIAIPDAVEDLIEAVYDDRPCPTDLPNAWRQAWEQTRRELEKQRKLYATEADVRRVEAPDYPGEILERFNAQMEEDNPEIHERLQALTRLTGPTVSVVCLTEPLAHPQETPDLDETKRLLARSVNLSLRGLTRTLIREGDIPSGWRKSALLRHHRLLVFDDAGVSRIGNWQVRLDPELGLLAEHVGKEAT